MLAVYLLLFHLRHHFAHLATRYHFHHLAGLVKIVSTDGLLFEYSYHYLWQCVDDANRSEEPDYCVLPESSNR